MESILAILISLAGLIAGSITDLRTREVPDFVNYGLMAAGLGLALIASIARQDYMILLSSLAGLGFFYLLGALLFYTGQWGGGDSKMLMGLGALIGIPLRWPLAVSIKEWPFLLLFIGACLMFGALYGVAWSFGLAIMHRKKFSAEYMRISGKKGVITAKYVVAAFMILMFMITYFNRANPINAILYLMLALIAPFLLYTSVSIKAIEAVCFFKHVTPDKLTEGDWIAEDVIIDGKYITGPKDLGIKKESIALLNKLYKKGKIKNILIKEGIPFVPSFLIAFIATLVYVYL